jgi:hypothetical protein
VEYHLFLSGIAITINGNLSEVDGGSGEWQYGAGGVGHDNTS